MSDEEMFVWVTHRHEGIHRYETAPDEVKFLRDYHRHMFHIRLTLQVFHDDREIEFILLKRFLTRSCDEIFGENPSGLSCEQIAKLIIERTQEEFGTDRKYVCEVSEDGENGATVKMNHARQVTLC